MGSKTVKESIFTLLVIFLPQAILVYLHESWLVMLIFMFGSVISCLFFLQYQIKHMKLGKDGFEFDTERIEKAINDAYATIDMVKDTIEPILEYTMRLMPGEDIAFGGTEPEERIRFFKDAIRLMNKYDIHNDGLNAAILKAKSSVIYSFENDLSYVRSTEGKLKGVFLRSANPADLESCDLEAFKRAIPTITVPEDRECVQARYEQLEQFLEETSDINEDSYRNDSGSD